MDERYEKAADEMGLGRRRFLKRLAIAASLGTIIYHKEKAEACCSTCNAGCDACNTGNICEDYNRCYLNRCKDHTCAMRNECYSDHCHYNECGPPSGDVCEQTNECMTNKCKIDICNTDVCCEDDSCVLNECKTTDIDCCICDLSCIPGANICSLEACS